MRVWDWMFGPRKLGIVHSSSNTINLEAIANDTDFTRDGNGLTIITGDVGQNVTLSMMGGSSLTISGNIGSGCRIYKEGVGTLTIEGNVAGNLKLTVYGQGSVVFNHRPPESVIQAITNRGGVAQIFCEGLPLLQPNQGYLRHNLGAARQPEPRLTPRAMSRLSIERPAAPPSSQLEKTVDQYPEITQLYITNYKERQFESVASRIKKLELTVEELPLFERFIDPITLDYFEGIPVMYDERYYNLSTLRDMYEKNLPDPFTRRPLKLANIQPARTALNNLDDVIKELLKKREAGTKYSENHQEQIKTSLAI